MKSKLILILWCSACLCALPANAVLLEARIDGSVEFNQINTGDLRGADSAWTKLNKSINKFRPAT